MADPQVSEVFQHVRSLLGEEPIQGEVYKDAMLLPFYSTAYRDIYNLFLSNSIPIPNRESYFVLPVYTTRVQPSQMNIADFSRPVRLWERGSAQSLTISAIAATTPISITTLASHGLSSNAEVNVYGATDENRANGHWYITVTGSATFTLNGSVGGTAGTTGTVSYSSEQWIEMRETDRISASPTISSMLTWWRWTGDAIEFTGASAPREIKIEYERSGSPPLAGSVGIDNSEDYLAYRTASLAARTRDEDRANQYAVDALGLRLQPDGSGGLLGAFLNPLIQKLQSIPRRRQPYRPRRHSVILRPYF